MPRVGPVLWALTWDQCSETRLLHLSSERQITAVVGVRSGPSHPTFCFTYEAATLPPAPRPAATAISADSKSNASARHYLPVPYRGPRPPWHHRCRHDCRPTRHRPRAPDRSARSPHADQASVRAHSERVHGANCLSATVARQASEAAPPSTG